jgi:hypothetical protein
MQGFLVIVSETSRILTRGKMNIQKRSLGCYGSLISLVVFIICLACAAAIFIPMRLNPGVVRGWEILKNDDSVIAEFGSPLHDIPIVLGKIESNMDGSGYGSVTAYFFGPKGIGRVEMYISKDEGSDWTLNSMRGFRGQKRVYTWVGQ